MLIMEKKVIVTLVATLILFGFLNFVFVNYMGIPFSPIAITGHAITNDTGIVSIFIMEVLNVYIDSPENITYNFSKGAAYIIDLNVSADFVVEPVDGWMYSLYDLKNEIFIEQNTLFTPNSSISAVRWGNLLTVSALSDGGQWANESVVFSVYVNNSAPLIGNISDPIYACEGERLNYVFNATDIDEDDLEGDISPKIPFYLSDPVRSGQVSFFNITSGFLSKGDLLGSPYSEAVYVEDPSEDVDSKTFDIEIIEINNVPVLQDDMGAQTVTVWLTGDDSSFYHVVNVTDIEDGMTADGNLTFNLSWGINEPLFDIGPNDGVMNYSPSVGHEGRVYNLEVCVSDNALVNPHPNVSLCFPRSGNVESACDTFSLTVTNDSRAPEILTYSPNVSTFGVLGTESVLYNVSVYDADGTIPDINWHVDGVLVEHNENVSVDQFAYAFGCGVSGAHSVEIITTDGLLNDSNIWYVNVENVECPVSAGGGEGGGGSSDGYCVEDWFCDDWNVCQNVKRSFNSEVLSLEDYSVAREACFQNKEEDERFCGFQVTQCHDLNVCEREDPVLLKPTERQFCYFTENPSCFDGITNCHDGACEVLSDCGGPCGACATCSDGKQNQGESDVDCGGPCPYLCEPEVPFAMISSVLIVVAIILIIVIAWVMWRLFLLWRNSYS